MDKDIQIDMTGYNPANVDIPYQYIPLEEGFIVNVIIILSLICMILIFLIYIFKRETNNGNKTN